MTFRVTSLLVAQRRWASLQRAPVAGVPYLLALSKSSLNGVLGGSCRNDSPRSCVQEWSANPAQSFQPSLRPPTSLADQHAHEALRFLP